jgi:hypothetical protein
MAWLVASDKGSEFQCESCETDQKRARNCKNETPNDSFIFQIGDIRSKADIESMIIRECPMGYITPFTQHLWARYTEVKIKHELGIAQGSFRKVIFDAFKVFFMVINEHESMQIRKDREKHNKGMMTRGKRNDTRHKMGD